MLPTSLGLTPQLRRAGYFIAIVTIIVQLTEVMLRAWPFRLHSPAWRISIVSSTTSTALTVLFMTFVLIAIAILAGDRPLTLVFSGFATLAAISFLVLSATFILDALQMRNQVQVSVSRRYDLTSVWELTRLLMGLVGFTMLALAGTRRAIDVGRQPTKRDVRLIMNTPKSGPIVSESAPVSKT